MNTNNISELFINMLNNTSTNTSSSSESNCSSEKTDITPEMITTLMNKVKSYNYTDDANANNSTSTSTVSNINSEDKKDLDIDTILKIKTIFESFNQNDDPKSNFLYSLKPYLRESRQQKIDQYVNLFKISGIIKMFKKEKGDIN